MIPPTLLKSALQHGVVLTVPVLHCAWEDTKRVKVPVHAAALATIAHVAPRQHAPVVIGHRFGRHPVPRPRKVLGPTHASRVVMVQAAAALQHAPVGCVQVTPVQVVLDALNVPGHSAATLTMQLPSFRQHAPLPVGGQGEGVQGTPKAQLEMPPHNEYSTDVHAPVERLQHAPSAGCGQGLGVQLAPLIQTLGEAQLASVTAVHAPVVGLQHDPVGGAGQGLVGVQLAPLLHTLVAAVQLARIDCTQLPVMSEQQVPLAGCGQGFGLQTWPSVHVVFAATH